MDDVTARARRVIARNALALTPAFDAGARMARNLVDAGRLASITHTMRHDPRFKGQDNERDAARHAEWSRRMAQVNPQMAKTVGDLNEVFGPAAQLGAWAVRKPRLPLREQVDAIAAARDMDLHNNAEGRAAAAEGRPVDSRRLQIAPRR